MSIEALIQAHTEALLANTDAVKLLTLSLAGRTPAKNETVKVVNKIEEPKAEIKPAKEEKKESPKVEESDTVSGADESADTEGKAVPYETVRALVLKLAPTQRAAIVALNAKHGLKNLKDLLDKEDDFSTVNDQAKLETVYADLQALEA